MSNVLMALPSFESPSVAAVTSEHREYPGRRCLDYEYPARLWRTTATTQQDLTLDFAAAKAINALLVNRTNYAEIQIWRSNDNVSYDLATPNGLLWSNKPRRTAGAGAAESPWASGSGVTVTPDAIAGPDPQGTMAQQVAWTTTNTGVDQTVTLGVTTVASRTFFAEIWVRADTAPSTKLMLISGADNATTAFVPTSSWRPYTVSLTCGGGNTNTTVQLAVRSNSGAGTIHLGPCQVTPDASASVGAIYESNALGVLVPATSLTGRRAGLYRFPGNSHRYWRLRIPSQTPTDGLSYFTTGGLTWTTALELVPGLHQFPRGQQVDKPNAETRFEDQATEYLKLGEAIWSTSLRGQYRAMNSESFLQRLARLDVGSVVIVGLNTWAPESPQQLLGPRDAYLAKLASTTHAFDYDIPEILNFEASLVEVT